MMVAMIGSSRILSEVRSRRKGRIKSEILRTALFCKTPRYITLERLSNCLLDAGFAVFLNETESWGLFGLHWNLAMTPRKLKVAYCFNGIMTITAFLLRESDLMSCSHVGFQHA
jgi:hypothetical protein